MDRFSLLIFDLFCDKLTITFQLQENKSLSAHEEIIHNKHWIHGY
jgi:hypothetical protein